MECRRTWLCFGLRNEILTDMETSEKQVYYIEIEHTQEDCRHALEQLHTNGFLSHFEWGCKEGLHRGFYRMETDDPKDPLRILPSYVREHAKITQVHKFTPKDLDAMH